jgi:hypothetical protein
MSYTLPKTKMTIFYKATKRYCSGQPGYCDVEWAISEWHTTRLACKEDCYEDQADDWEARCSPSIMEDKFYTWETKHK